MPPAPTGLDDWESSQVEKSYKLPRKNADCTSSNKKKLQQEEGTRGSINGELDASKNNSDSLPDGDRLARPD